MINEPEPEPIQQGVCYWKLDIINYIFICWSVGVFWAGVGAFTARGIIARRGRGDEEMVFVHARPLS